MINPNHRPVYAVLAGAGGIGSALCRQLAEGGAKVAVGGRKREKVEALADEIGGLAVEVDGRSFEQVENLLNQAAELGDLVGAANCAGSLLLKPAHLTREEELQDTLDANITTAFALVRAAARSMKDGGSVVLMSSAAARIGLPNHEAIAAAKGAVEGLVGAAAATYAGRGLRVNAVAPGLVDTPLAARITGNEKALEASRSLHPLGRIGQPEEVAALIAWLLGPDSGWVTGQVWGTDGGLASLKGG
ncbi:MAG: SDR family oxidoreductase [Acidobacteriota bacterium]